MITGIMDAIIMPMMLTTPPNSSTVAMVEDTASSSR
jgi:hypothetical protein